MNTESMIPASNKSVSLEFKSITGTGLHQSSNDLISVETNVIDATRRKTGNEANYRMDENKDLVLFSRKSELRSVGNEEYGNKVNDTIKSYLLQCLGKINEIRGERNESLVIYNDENNIYEIASKCAEGLSNFKQKSIIELNYAMMAIDQSFNSELDESGAVYNGIFCSSIFMVLFAKHFEYQELREQIKKIDLNATSESVLNQEAIKWDKRIEKLENFIEKFYYTKLRQLLDPDMDLQKKLVCMDDYARPLNSKLLSNHSEFFDSLYKLVLPYEVRNIVENVSYLQILLDSLKKINKAPNTKENLEIVLKICKKCYKIYLDEKVVNKNYPYTIRHKSVKSFLKQLKEALETQIKQMMPRSTKKDELEDWLTPSTRSFWDPRNHKKNLLAKNPAKIQVANDSTNSAPKEVEIKSVDPKVATKETIISKEDLQEVGLTSMHSTVLEEDDFESIERETNALMEVFRQYVEGDRKKKIEHKEALQASKARRSISSIETETLIDYRYEDDRKPIPIKLNNRRQDTLEKVMKVNPPHLEILGSDVESLIKKLGGRVAGGGNGSEFDIFWGDSKSKAGDYEVTHGKDRDGTLTSENARKVANGINVGVQYGLIAEESIKLE